MAEWHLGRHGQQWGLEKVRQCSEKRGKLQIIEFMTVWSRQSKKGSQAFYPTFLGAISASQELYKLFSQL